MKGDHICKCSSLMIYFHYAQHIYIGGSSYERDREEANMLSNDLTVTISARSHATHTRHTSIHSTYAYNLYCTFLKCMCWGVVILNINSYLPWSNNQNMRTNYCQFLMQGHQDQTHLWINTTLQALPLTQHNRIWSMDWLLYITVMMWLWWCIAGCIVGCMVGFDYWSFLIPSGWGCSWTFGRINNFYLLTQWGCIETHRSVNKHQVYYTT